MAIAEVRAAWQRTANRCLVQEDAKRAPKLACCPSSSSPIKQVDIGPPNAAEKQDIPDVGFLPYSHNPSYSNVSPDSRWWLYLQPNHSYTRGFVKGKLDSKLSEMDTFESGLITASKPPSSEDGGAFFYESVDAESFVDSHFRIPTNCVKNDDGVGKQLLTPTYKQDPRDSFKVEDARNLYELEQTGDAGCAVSKNTNELFYDCESRWIGGERTEPWWHTSDRDELALLVAQRSFGLLENCDLPQPQNTCVKREPFADLCCYDHAGISESSLDHKQSRVHNDLIKYNQHTLASIDHHLSSAATNPLRDEVVPEEITSENGPDKDQLLEALRQVVPEEITSENGPDKDQLLEALRHSQTRAREAEKAAKQAYEEKEHVVKLVFRQASQLFAYKQWFQLLQLENLYFQIKNQNEPMISSLFPVKMPWMPPKSRKVRKSWQKASRARRVHHPHPKSDNISKYAVVFALGLSLVGAGLLLGWTAGWMLPTF